MILVIKKTNVSTPAVASRFYEGDLQQLRCFYYAATYSSFTRAAYELATGQPSVSNHIKKLERLLGVPLFHRQRRGVELTPSGRILFDLLGPLVEGIDRLPHELEERVTSLATREVRLAAGQELLLHILAPILRIFREENPSVRLIVYARVRGEAQIMVAQGEVDFGVSARAGLPPGLDFQELLADQLVLIAPPNHELAPRHDISLEDIARYPILMPDSRSSTRRSIEEAFDRSGLKLQIAMELERWQVIKEFVALNQGIALVPSFSLGGDHDRFAVKQLHHNFPRLSYGIITRRGAYLAPAARSLIEAVRSQHAKPARA